MSNLNTLKAMAADPATGRQLTIGKATVNVVRLDDAKTLLVQDKSITCCGTGRRPKDLAGYGDHAYDPFMTGLKQTIRDLYAHGIRRFVTGGAQGFDQLMFWAVYHVSREEGYGDIENVLFMPFEGQCSTWKDTGLFSKKQYSQMLRYADLIVLCCDLPAGAPYTQVAQALTNRNSDMLDVSYRVLALFPDNSWFTAQKGGTADCMKKAYYRQIPILQIMYSIKSGVLHYGYARYASPYC